MELLREVGVFSVKTIVYSGVISVIGLLLSWILYRYIVIRNVSIRDALFEKDNFAAWVEFVGAFILPIFILAAKAIDGESADAFTYDLFYGTLYVLSYTLMFTVLRIICGWVVYFVSGSDEHGKIHLYKEVYEQSNVSASLFSISFAVVFMNMLLNLNLSDKSSLEASGVVSMEILMLSLIFGLAYVFVRKGSLMKQIFEENNVAIGISYLGYMIAVQLILNAAVNFQGVTTLVDKLILSVIGLIVLFVMVFFIRALYSKVLKVKVSEEMVVQKNLGAGMGDLALFIGVALVIAHFY